MYEINCVVSMLMTKGVGKTSLIKSILQTCEDIVHVDPLSSNSPSLDTLPSKKSRRKNVTTPYNSTTSITEIYASTRPYPSWWSNFEENKVLKRRRSMGDVVLERNICFVDTPGISTRENVDSILNYIDSQATRTLDLNRMDSGDLVSLVAGNGGCQVDVVFYVFSKGTFPWPREYLLTFVQLTSSRTHPKRPRFSPQAMARYQRDTYSQQERQTDR